MSSASCSCSFTSCSHGKTEAALSALVEALNGVTSAFAAAAVGADGPSAATLPFHAREEAGIALAVAARLTSVAAAHAAAFPVGVNTFKSGAHAQTAASLQARLREVAATA
jgi:hypothetical protein